MSLPAETLRQANSWPHDRWPVRDGRDGSPHPLEPFRQLVGVNLVSAFHVLRLAAAMAGKGANEDGTVARSS